MRINCSFRANYDIVGDRDDGLEWLEIISLITSSHYDDFDVDDDNDNHHKMLLLEGSHR